MIGKLVQFEHPETLEIVLGTVIHVMRMEDGWPMCEVICTNPLTRFWIEDIKLKVVSS